MLHRYEVCDFSRRKGIIIAKRLGFFEMNKLLMCIRFETASKAFDLCVVLPS